MESFPLYDTLYNDVKDKKSLDQTEKTKLTKLINQTLDQDGKNKIYALIRYFDLNYESISVSGNVREIIPYNGRYVNGELIFDLDNLPDILQKILSGFTKLHIQHMKDQQKMEKKLKNCMNK